RRMEPGSQSSTKQTAAEEEFRLQAVSPCQGLSSPGRGLRPVADGLQRMSSEVFRLRCRRVVLTAQCRTPAIPDHPYCKRPLASSGRWGGRSESGPAPDKGVGILYC